MISSTATCVLQESNLGAGPGAHHHPLALTRAEALETARIHRVTDRTGDRTALVTTRPFRVPHHTISDVGLMGGGEVPMPGEVSLAHHGVRYPDERPASRGHVLEVLRQLLEEGVIYLQSRRRPES